MKTLDQVEARIPLVAGQPGVSINAAGTITISASGSYYLTGNLTISTVGASAIFIVDTAFPLTLDLNGYSLICTSVLGGDAITGNPNGSVTVRNGHILGGTTVSGSTFTLNGWNSGVSLSGVQVLVEHINVRGVREHGIEVPGSGSRVQSCLVDITGVFGIVSPTVLDSSARRCQADGIWVGNTTTGNYLISNCIAESIGSNVGNKYGIDANSLSGTSMGGVVTNCVASAVLGYGIKASQVTLSSGKGSLVGITAKNVTNSYGTAATGISCNTASFCRGHSTTAGTAISADIAIGCTKENGTIDSAQKHLGTP